MRNLCTIEGCDRFVAGRGLCGMHWQRWKKHGDPLVTRLGGAAPGSDNSQWKGDQASYSAIHKRVQTARGRAKDRGCAHCPEPAAQWCYDYLDPYEFLAEKNDGERWLMLVSTDPEHYLPLCVPCHNEHDRSARTARHHELHALRALVAKLRA